MKPGWNETSYNFTISSNVTWTSLLTSSLLYACLIRIMIFDWIKFKMELRWTYVPAIGMVYKENLKIKNKEIMTKKHALKRVSMERNSLE